jgi:hypothetical protein
MRQPTRARVVFVLALCGSSSIVAMIMWPLISALGVTLPLEPLFWSAQFGGAAGACSMVVSIRMYTVRTLHSLQVRKLLRRVARVFFAGIAIGVTLSIIQHWQLFSITAILTYRFTVTEFVRYAAIVFPFTLGGVLGMIAWVESQT